MYIMLHVKRFRMFNFYTNVELWIQIETIKGIGLYTKYEATASRQLA